MSKETDSWPGAITKTGTQTGKMSSGDIQGGGRGGDKMNKPNPYGPDPKSGDRSHGGKAASSEENY